MRFAAWTAASIALIHLLFSTALALWAPAQFGHRLFNLRHTAWQHWDELTTSFIAATARSDRPLVLVVGSSFSWGFDWPEPETFPRHLQDALPDYEVVNLSIVGADLTQSLRTLCSVERLGLKPVLLILEVSVPNLLPSAFVADGARTCPDGPGSGMRYRTAPLFWLYITNPWGLQHLAAFMDDYLPRLRGGDFIRTEIPPGFIHAPEQFWEQEEALAGFIAGLLDRAGRLAQHTVLFPAALQSDELQAGGLDMADLRARTAAVMVMCGRQAGVTCIDPGFDLPRDQFINVSHLNRPGHRFFAQWLLEQIRANGALGDDAPPQPSNTTAE